MSTLNMRHFPWLVRLVLVVLWLAPVVSAQPQDDSCPALVQRALDATDAACGGIGRNQACYGNIQVQAEFHPGIEAPVFDQPGDIVSISQVRALQLTAMDTARGRWGLALLRIQANLPDTLPGQNVTLLLFGDVELEDTMAPLVTLEMTTTANVNVRLQPTSNAQNVITSLAPGEVVTATGRLADNSWIRIMTTAHRNGTGWVAAPFLRTEGDINSLSIVGADEQGSGPMQAFYFRSGVGDAPCVEAPDSGILIQTPEGAGEVQLTVNGVNITVASTVYLQAHAELRACTAEGEMRVEALGEAAAVPAGMCVRVPLDETGRAASGPPAPLEPGDLDTIRAMMRLLPGETRIPTEAEPNAEETPTPDEAGGPPGQNYTGSWAAVDADGSHMTLQIDTQGDGSFNVYLYDEGASVCGKDAGGAPLYPAELPGVGHIENGQLVVDSELWCLGPERRLLSRPTVVFSHDLATDTLTDDAGVVWSRT